MPINPIAGVSILFHLVIIGWCTLKERIPKRYLPRLTRKERKMSERAFMVVGCGIIASMFLFVLSGAGILVYSSLQDEHATYHYVPQALSSAEALAVDATPNITAARALALVVLFTVLGLLRPGIRSRIAAVAQAPRIVLAARVGAVTVAVLAFTSSTIALAFRFANDAKDALAVSKEGQLVIAPKNEKF